ncbi:unnamed protein product [Mucor hiemalis]
MSYLNYKATFKAKNRYLNFFCVNPASKWDYKNFHSAFGHDRDISLNLLRKTYDHCLTTVKDDSKDITKDLNKYIDGLLNPKGKEKEVASMIINNNYNNTGDVFHGGHVLIDKRKIKKQKLHDSRSKKEGEQEESDDWLTILEICEAAEDAHKYSPERNGVRRIAPKLSEEKVGVPKGLHNKITSLVLKIQKKKPSISYSEAVYNDRFVFRLMDILIEHVEDHSMCPFFVAGEEELVAMSKQIQKLKPKADHRKMYKADGIVRVIDDLEVMLVETAGAFAKYNAAKTSFNNSKGMFALLAMLKTLADKYALASTASFKKVKLLFLQPSDREIRLWQMCYKQNGYYEYIRIAKAHVEEEQDSKQACIKSLCTFSIKAIEALTETLESVENLKKEHDAKKEENESDYLADNFNLSDIICPKIFKISFGRHARGFGSGVTLSPNDK